MQTCPAPRYLTFASILKFDLYPLPGLLKELLAMGREGMGCEVEIEFAVDLHDDPARSIFYFLQIRPTVIGSETQRVKIIRPGTGAVLSSLNTGIGSWYI